MSAAEGHELPQSVDHQMVDAPISPPIPSPTANAPEKHVLGSPRDVDEGDAAVKRVKLDAESVPVSAVQSLSETTNVPTPQESELEQQQQQPPPHTTEESESLTNVAPASEVMKQEEPEVSAISDESGPTVAADDKVITNTPTPMAAPAIITTPTSSTTPVPSAATPVLDGPILPEGEYDPPAGSTEKGLPKHQLKYAASVLRSVKRLKDAAPFLAPVDAVKLNIPTYYDVIKNPVDLGTMDRKLNANEYDSVSSFVADFELLVDNCVRFNGAESFVTNMAKNVRSSFIKHMQHMPLYVQTEVPKAAPKRKSFAPPADGNIKSQRAAAQAANAALNGEADSPSFALQPSGIPTIRRESMVTEGGRLKREIHPPKPRDLPYGDVKPRKKKYAAELKFCGQVLKELTNRKYESFSYPFLLPVDPVALGCPSYFKIIKQPMDLSTVQEKYNTNQYETADDFAHDVRLVFKNCYKFNSEGSPVNMMGHRLEAIFDKKWLDKPAPAPSPPPQSGRDSDLDLSEDEDYEDVIITNPAIKFLEEQIERMTAELNKLKKEAMRDYREQRRKVGVPRKRKSGVNGSVKKEKGDRKKSDRQSSLTGLTNGPTHVTYEMKVQMSEMIMSLPEKKLRHVVQIIQESMPQLKNSSEDEIELDLEKIDPATLLKLYNFVVRDNCEKKAPRPSNGSVGGGSQKRRKSKPLTEDEQSREIESLQQKLREFDNMQTGGNSQSPPAAATAAIQDSSDDSSDDDDDSSSSEEE